MAHGFMGHPWVVEITPDPWSRRSSATTKRTRVVDCLRRRHEKSNALRETQGGELREEDPQP